MSNMYSTEYGRKSLGKTDVVKHPPKEDGCSVWLESGEWFAAPTIDRAKFGGHDYDNGGYAQGIRDCKCGAYMLSSSSAGPVDPFGACPLNPISASPVDTAVPSGVVNQWQAIESAPKDGTVIWIRESERHAAIYNSRKDIWVSPDGAYGYDPTEWQPIGLPSSDEQQNNSVDEDKNPAIPSSRSQATLALDAALTTFRNGIGFQINFVLYSGLDGRTAIEHICSAADKLVTATRESEQERCAKIAEICSCGSGPEFRPMNQRFHSINCSIHIAALIRSTTQPENDRQVTTEESHRQAFVPESVSPSIETLAQVAAEKIYNLDENCAPREWLNGVAIIILEALRGVGGEDRKSG